MDILPVVQNGEGNVDFLVDYACVHVQYLLNL